MRTLAIASALLVATASWASAAPGYKHDFGRHFSKSAKVGKLTWRERKKIRRSRARLAALKRRAWADGRLTRFERRRIRQAQVRLRVLIRKVRRD